MRVRIASYGCFIFGLALFQFNIQTFGQVDKANLVGTIRDGSGASGKVFFRLRSKASSWFKPGKGRS